jgi:hypothetical protein
MRAHQSELNCYEQLRSSGRASGVPRADRDVERRRRHRSRSPSWNDQNLFDRSSHVESSIVHAKVPQPA